MWETILEMADDRLWIYTGIVGALFGAAFLAYFKDTTLGLWCYSKFDSFLDIIVYYFGWTWFEQQDDAWRRRYPMITKKIDELESEIQKLNKKVRKG